MRLSGAMTALKPGIYVSTVTTHEIAPGAERSPHVPCRRASDRLGDCSSSRGRRRRLGGQRTISRCSVWCVSSSALGYPTLEMIVCVRSAFRYRQPWTRAVATLALLLSHAEPRDEWVRL